MANTSSPKVNKGKPGTPAIANKVAIANPQSIGDNPTTSAIDIYPYQSSSNVNNHYKNYNFQNMTKEQVGKLKAPLSRFSLICNGYKFQAHIDPNHIVNNQAKRIVQLDTLTGIVLQDYGYAAQTIELRGTTGAAFYIEIAKLNDVFNNQSTNAAPTPCQLTLEGITYTGVWKDFSYERQAQDNIYRYTIAFTVMYVGKNQHPSLNNSSSSVIASKTAANALAISDGKNKVNYMPWGGKTPAAFVAATSSIPASQRTAALSFLRTNWSRATNNKKRSYPGDNSTLNSNEVLVIPLNWDNVLNNQMAANVSGGNSAPL